MAAIGFHSENYRCPEWYADALAARWLGIPVPEIINVPIYWIDKAIIAMSAENQARKNLENHNK